MKNMFVPNQRIKDNPKPFRSYVRRRLITNDYLAAISNVTGVPLMDDKMVDNRFNNIFATNFNSDFDSSWCSTILSACLRVLDSRSFSPDDTSKVINSLLPSRTVDGDGLCYLLLKRGGAFLDSKLSAFFNFSFMHCSIIDKWLSIEIIPIYKSGPKMNCANYLPIAITSCVCRVLVRLMYKCIYDFFVNTIPLHPSQHGFLLGCSVETASIAFLDFLTRNLERSSIVDVVFLNFEKTFDKVHHLVLLNKLQKHGITDLLLK